MDALQIMDQLDRVRPALQPIVSAITHEIAGYELLGRYREDDHWTSLGDFFLDSDIPTEFKNELDDHLIGLAVDYLLENDLPGYLSINRSAQQLIDEEDETFLAFLHVQEKKGFALKRFVLEVTEHDIEEEFESLNHLLRYYKTYGIRLAIDHIGGASSNIDRIRALRPDILKIDTSLTRSANLENFQDILHTLSVLARRIGAVLSYEMIEDANQLYFAWKNNGHYYQGFYLGRPSCEQQESIQLNVSLPTQIQSFVEREKELITQRLKFTEACHHKLKKLSKWQDEVYADQLLQEAQELFDKQTFRLYICDASGKQVSSNFRLKDGSWRYEETVRGSNWAFRPYFLENMMRMQRTNQGRLSDLYSDIETREYVRTFSFPLTANYFLFVDLSYEFITMNDFLFMN